MAYYIVYSEINQRVLATRVFEECYDFVKLNMDAKTKYLDNMGNCKKYDKRKFIRDMYMASKKSWTDKIKIFELTEILIKSPGAFTTLIAKLHLTKDYNLYKQIREEVF